MANMRVHELAKELNISSKDITDMLSNNEKKYTAMSGLGEAEINSVKGKFKAKPVASNNAVKSEPKKAEERNVKIQENNKVEEKKVNTFFNQVKEVIEAGHLTKQIQWLENFCSESETEYGVVDIAAALLKIALGDEEKQEIVEEPSRSRKEGRSKSKDTGASEGMIRLFINVGRNQRVQAKDILGAIAGEVGIPGKLVGTIDIYDKYTFVEVPKQNAKKVLEKMKDIKIKGNKINIERANRKRK